MNVLQSVRFLAITTLVFALGVLDVLAQAPGTLTTLAGNGSFTHTGDGGPATSAGIMYANGVARAPDGTLYIADGNARVRKVTPQGIISTFAGNGSLAFAGDGGLATGAALQYASGVAIDDAGNVYIADQGNHRIRMVDTSGIITTVAGTGTAGFSGDGGPATAGR